MKTGDDKNNHWHFVDPDETGMDIVGFGMHKGHFRVNFQTKHGVSVYQYTTQEKDLCCRWEMSTSIGRFFHTYVKPLPYAKIS